MRHHNQSRWSELSFEQVFENYIEDIVDLAKRGDYYAQTPELKESSDKVELATLRLRMAAVSLRKALRKRSSAIKLGRDKSGRS